MSLAYRLYVARATGDASRAGDQLLAAARELFAERGYGGVGTEEIVAGART